MTIISTTDLRSSGFVPGESRAPAIIPQRRTPLPGKLPEVKPLPERIVEAIVAYKKDHSLSDEKFAKLIGSNASQVNRACNGKFVGDVEAFVSRVEEFFRGETTRRVDTTELFQNKFTDRVWNFLETVRRTGDIGIGYSPAGKGKTCAINLFLSANPSAIGITVSRWNRNAAGVTRLVFDNIEHRGWSPGRCSYAEWIVQRLKGSRRPLIIDNAHRLNAGGLQWVFDFHDETGCPISLVGNPEILDEIRKNDQQFSRIGLKRELKSGRNGEEALTALTEDCARMIELHWPEASGQLGDLPVQVAGQHGHLRALKKQLLLAREMASQHKTASDAFRAAHTQLVRNYALR